MAWIFIWFLVAQVSAIQATNCFMVNDLKHKLRWEVTGSNGPCPCYSMLPGGVSASLPPDKDVKLCHETTNLNLSNAILTLSPSSGCDVTETGNITPQGTEETKLQSTDDVTEGLTKRTTTKATTKITSKYATTRGIFVPTTTDPSEPQHRRSTQETPTYSITPQKSTLQLKGLTEEPSTIYTTTPVLSTIHASTPVLSTIHTTTPVLSTIHTTTNIITSTDDKKSTTHETKEAIMESTENQVEVSESTSNPETSTLFESTTHTSTTNENTSTISSETTLDISTLDSETTESDTTTAELEDTTNGATAKSTDSSTTTQRISTNSKTTVLESTQKQSTVKTSTTKAFVSTDKILSTVAESTSSETSTTSKNQLTTAATTSESPSTTENIVMTTSRRTTTGGHQPACQEGTLYMNSCYIVHVNNVTLADAEKDCQAFGNNTRLVSLQDENETIFVTNLVSSSPMTSALDFWIGLKNTEFKWIEGTYLSYENFGYYTDDLDYCFFYDKLYFWPWLTLNCTIPLNFICEFSWYGSPGNPDGCDLLEGNTCYILEPARETFTNAFDYCKTIGGTLLKLETFEEENMVKSIIPNDGVWLGLDWTSGEQSEFVWSDRVFSPAQYTNFGNSFGGYGKFCLHLDASDSFKWVDDNCEHLKAFICEENLE